MSCYGWERGTVVLPSAQWAAFRTSLIKAWNDKQGELLALAERAYKAASDAAKGKRGENRQKAVEQAVAQACGGKINEHGEFEVPYRYWGGSPSDDTIRERYEAVSRLVLKQEGWGKDRKVELQTPKKKDLAVYPTSKGCTIEMPEASVTFDNDRKAITWDVPENNRSVERAHEHWFAIALFAALAKIEWKRNSGGDLVGNDEYNRESEHAGGGANYVTFHFGPKSKKEREAEARTRRYSYGRGW